MKQILGVVAFGMTVMSGVSASAEALNCTFPNQKIDGWIRGQVFLKPDGAGAYTVYDSLINQKHGGPIAARVSADNDKRLTVKWTLKRIELRHGDAPRVDYTLNYLKRDGSATINAQAPELNDYNKSSFAGGTFGARGSCQAK